MVATLVVTQGCASYTEETKEIRTDYRDANYAAALKKLDSSSLKDEDKNRLLFRLEKAMILDRMGEHVKARALLVEADKIADELYTTSISRSATSFIVNDAASDYSGEDYEKVAIHTELALSFIGTKNLDDARVEARKINNKLAEINSKYEDHKDKYGEDGFARYLSAVIYEARGEDDDAIIDYNKALDLYRGEFAQFVDGGVPDDLVRALYRLLIKRNRTDRAAKLEHDYPRIVALAKQDLAHDDYGEVVVIHEVGHIAIKTSEDFVLPIGRQIVRFSYPVIKTGRQRYYGGSSVTDESSHQSATAENVEDLNSIAKITLEDARGRMMAKEAARLIAKGVLTEAAYKKFGILGGIAANAAAAVSETADTRGWTLLPEAFFISRLKLKPGTHTIKIQTGGRLGKIEDITVHKGQIVILRDVG